MPYTTAMRRLRNTDSIGSAKFVVADPDNVEEVTLALASILRQRHGIQEDESDDFAAFHSKYAGQRSLRANRVLKLYVPLVGGLVLLVAAIVISNIMLTVVRQRIAEVGVRKAVGATEGQIEQQFLAESFAITLAFGSVGVLLGTGIALIAARMMEQPPLVTPDSWAMGLGAAMLVGMVAGLIPARRAARLDPIEALR